MGRVERLVLPSRVWLGKSYDQVNKLYEYIESRRNGRNQKTRAKV